VRFADVLPHVPDEIKVGVLLLAISITHAVFAFVMWHLALRAFAKRRYGDIEASGKGAN